LKSQQFRFLLAACLAAIGCDPTATGDSDLSSLVDAAGRADSALPIADGASASDVAFPIPDWPTVEPELAGFDFAELEDAAAYAESVGSLCLLVIRDGALVYERYWNGTTATSVQKSWSIAKSFTSALVGIAIRRGEIESVDQSAAAFVPAWRGTEREAITIADLLSMDSGLTWDLISDNTWTVTTADQTAEALGLDLAEPPGSVWHYSNHGVQVFHEILRNATGMDPEEYAEQYLWGPIGMNLDGPKEQRTHWERDGAGNPTMYMSVHSSCRDLARFGYLFLNGGNWAGEQLIDPAYVAQAVSPSQDLNRAYGYLWWVNGEQPAIDPTDDPIDGPLFDFAPDDLFAALGIGQSFIDVIPSTHTMYVHMRPAPHDPLTNFLTDFWGTLTRLFADGKLIEHRELLRRLLDAS